MIGGGVGGRLAAERHRRWQWRLARRERHDRRWWRLAWRERHGDSGRPDWRERRVRGWRRLTRRDEARPAVKETTTVQGEATGGCGAVFDAQRPPGGGASAVVPHVGRG
uniref:Uncharacterized protein n=1 Tax=Oryza rufipogon TaxID=4529 RepID=A0A0E0QKB3_ORYRU